MFSGVSSLLVRPSLHLLSTISILFANRSSLPEFAPCSHGDSKNFRAQDIHWNRKFRRRLRNILQSGDWDESFGRVCIVELRSGSDGRNMTVRWSMDEEEFTSTGKAPQLHEICRVGVLLNRTVPSIRRRLARENAFKKVPSLTFIHHSQSSVRLPLFSQCSILVYRGFQGWAQ
uniref:Ribosome-binding factor A n=1 Tax=Schistocephalus solidus TaxID=70667 RepID=A0A0X3NWT7_SCHSO